MSFNAGDIVVVRKLILEATRAVSILLYSALRSSGMCGSILQEIDGFTNFYYIIPRGKIISDFNIGNIELGIPYSGEELALYVESDYAKIEEQVIDSQGLVNWIEPTRIKTMSVTKPLPQIVLTAAAEKGRELRRTYQQERRTYEARKDSMESAEREYRQTGEKLVDLATFLSEHGAGARENPPVDWFIELDIDKEHKK